MNQQTKATLRSISTVLVIIVAILAFLISGIRLFGFQVYGVLSGSMEPTYAVGSLVYVKAVDPDELKLRDVITFSVSPKTVVTHRIVEIVPDENNPAMNRYRTRGDANESADASLVGPADIIGKVAFSVPHLGNVASYIQSPPGIYVAIAIGIALIAIVIITDSPEGKNTPADKQKKTPAPESPFVTKLKEKLGMGKAKQQEQPLGRGYVPQQPQYQQPQQYQQYQQYQQPQQYQQYQPVQQYQQPVYQQGYVQPVQQYQQPYAQPQQYQPVQQPVYQQPQQYAPQPYGQQEYAQQPQQYQPQGYPQQRIPRSARNYNGQQ